METERAAHTCQLGHWHVLLSMTAEHIPSCASSRKTRLSFVVLSLMCQCRSSYLGTACLFLRRLDVCSVAFSVDIKINDEGEYGQLTLSLLFAVLRSHSSVSIHHSQLLSQDWEKSISCDGTGKTLISGTFGKATQISTKLNN
jgi:hypothetical protein